MGFCHKGSKREFSVPLISLVSSRPGNVSASCIVLPLEVPQAPQTHSLCQNKPVEFLPVLLCRLSVSCVLGTPASWFPNHRPGVKLFASPPGLPLFSVSPGPLPAPALPVCALALSSTPLAVARSIACEAFLLQPCHGSLFPSRTSLNECSLLRLCLGLPLTHCTWSVLFTVFKLLA